MKFTYSKLFNIRRFVWEGTIRHMIWHSTNWLYIVCETGKKHYCTDTPLTHASQCQPSGENLDTSQQEAQSIMPHRSSWKSMPLAAARPYNQRTQTAAWGVFYGCQHKMQTSTEVQHLPTDCSPCEDWSAFDDVIHWQHPTAKGSTRQTSKSKSSKQTYRLTAKIIPANTPPYSENINITRPCKNLHHIYQRKKKKKKSKQNQNLLWITFDWSKCFVLMKPWKTLKQIVKLPVVHQITVDVGYLKTCNAHEYLRLS